MWAETKFQDAAGALLEYEVDKHDISYMVSLYWEWLLLPEINAPPRPPQAFPDISLRCGVASAARVSFQVRPLSSPVR